MTTARRYVLRRATGLSLAVVAAMLLFGLASDAAFPSSGSGTNTRAATHRAVAPLPTLVVVVLGSGGVTSQPAGISCPGKCKATFAVGTSVVLTQKARNGSSFLRWGGNCTGAGACRVRVSALAAVAAQFLPGATQPPPTSGKSVEPGTYAAFPVTFFVPAGAGSVLNFSNTSANGVAVNCAGGGQYLTPFKILKATIKGDRSFTAKTSQSGVVGGANATITYFVTGRFQGQDAAGAATAAGVYREDIVFTDTPNRRCTSNDQPWTATRSLPPATKSIEPGTYSAFPVTFVVPAGAGSVLNFSNTSANGVAVNCAGGGQYLTPFKILKATIKGDRSFTAKTSQSGVVGGANATITYFVTGYFQGPNAAGAATASGVYREDIVFTDTPNRKCTSNDQPWTATRSP